MLSTPIESRDFWLERVSETATALAATRASECPDGEPKPSEVEIRYFDPSYGRAGMQAAGLSKYKVPAVLVGMVAVVLAISLTAFLALEQRYSPADPTRDWAKLVIRLSGTKYRHRADCAAGCSSSSRRCVDRAYPVGFGRGGAS